MNIVRVVFNKNILASALCIVGTLGAVRYALTPAQYTVFCDQRLAPEVQAGIKKIIREAPTYMLTADALRTELQKVYPAVRDVSVGYNSSLKAKITVQAHVPFILICSSMPGCKEYILCKLKQPQDSCMVEKKYFNEYATASMATVIVASADFEETIRQPEFVECMREVKRDLLDEYAVTWRSKTEIVAQCHDRPLVLIADSMMIHESERRAAVRRIFAADAERYKDGMRADIRLRDSIICAPFKGIYEKPVDL